MTTMDTIGLDLHKRESQLCILAEDGSVTECRIVTSRERFTRRSQLRPDVRHAIAPGEDRSPRCTNARRGSATGGLPSGASGLRGAATHSRRARGPRSARADADALWWCYVSLAKALVRRDGLRVASREAHLAAARIAALELSPMLEAEVAPLVHVLAPINDEITAADTRLERYTRDDPIIALLATAPSVGPVTASAIVATVDDIRRFRSAHQFEAFLGLVPGERSSGETHRIGAITKAGNSRVRYSAGRGRLADSAIQGRRHRRAPGVGARHRRAAWATNRGRRPGSPACRHPLREVA
jgi:transposase